MLILAFPMLSHVFYVYFASFQWLGGFHSFLHRIRDGVHCNRNCRGSGMSHTHCSLCYHSNSPGKKG